MMCILKAGSSMGLNLVTGKGIRVRIWETVHIWAFGLDRFINQTVNQPHKVTAGSAYKPSDGSMMRRWLGDLVEPVHRMMELLQWSQKLVKVLRGC